MAAVNSLTRRLSLSGGYDRINAKKTNHQINFWTTKIRTDSYTLLKVSFYNGQGAFGFLGHNLLDKAAPMKARQMLIRVG